MTGDFMWMVDTRRYLHLAASGEAFAFESPDLYRPFPLRRAIIDVFACLPGLAGVTDEQISASWAAVVRSEAVDTHLRV